LNTENFECEYIYHVYTHANGKDLIFREQENYRYFLDKLTKYIVPIAEIYAYVNEHKYLMKQFSNLLNGYAKAYNKRYHRKGSLFLDYLKRKKVNDEKYLIKLIHYIHNNPVNHGFIENIDDWKYSSYQSYINLGKETKIVRAEIMQYFDTVDNFIEYHQSNVEYDFMIID
jgi:REP element-mobilizing transposase RayT